MTEDLIGVERRGDVCVLTLRRPEKLNALSTALERALADALDSAERRAGCGGGVRLGQGSSQGGDSA